MAIQSFMIPYAGRMDYRNCSIIRPEPHHQVQRFPSFQFNMTDIRRVRSNGTIEVSFSSNAVSTVAEEGESVVSFRGTITTDSVVIEKELIIYLDNHSVNTETHLWILTDCEDVTTIWTEVQTMLTIQ